MITTIFAKIYALYFRLSANSDIIIFIGTEHIWHENIIALAYQRDWSEAILILLN